MLCPAHQKLYIIHIGHITQEPHPAVAIKIHGQKNFNK
jgi:hypothetical protein